VDEQYHQRQHHHGWRPSIASIGDLFLGNTSANSLTVTAKSIQQTGPLSVFGLSSFTSNGTGGVTLTNSANNFGPIAITVTTANQNVSLTESGTLNLRAVSMPGGGNGTFTANSVNGDIIDTGFGGVALGGAAAVGVTPAVNGNGLVTLLATNGNIVIDDFTSSVNINTTSGNGIVFNAKDVTLSVVGGAGSNVTLGAAGQVATATGNLTVLSVSGGINQSGPVRAGGLASFQAQAGAVSLANTGNGFGTVRFIGNTVNIVEAGNVDIATGSSSVGSATIQSVTGSISITNVGGSAVSFGSTVLLNAAQSITLPKLMTAAGQLTLLYTGTANLSALSQATDLSGLAPINGGSAGSTYIGPGQ